MPQGIQEAASTHDWRFTPGLVIALVLCVSIPATAQTFASLRGRIFDADGGLVPGAIIRVHERVEAIGGTFELRSRPGAGTRPAVRVPFSASWDATSVAV